MKHVKKSVLLFYSAREMYDLVVRVEEYPRFLPWCESSAVLERQPADLQAGTPERVTARLALAFAGVRHAFTTRNENVHGRSVSLELVDGPFSSLDGAWQFKPLAEPGAAEVESTACRVEFDLSYAFSSRAFEAVLSPVFDRVADTFVDSFVKRAAQVYGER